MKSGLSGLMLGAFLCAGMSGCSAPQQDAATAPWLEFAWPAADLLFQRDSFWVGGDGAYSIDLGRGRVLWLFGDSWVDPTGGGSRDGATMVSNTLAIQNGYDPTRATADFFWGTAPDGGVGAFFPDFSGGRYWPGHGLRVEDRLILFLMEVRSTDAGLGFEVADWAAVLVTNPDDDPSEWDVAWLDTPANQRQIIVGSGSVLLCGEHVCAFGAQESGPRHDVYLVRWPREDVPEGRLERMEWWAGSEGGWVADRAGGAARPVFSIGQTEFTVHHDEGSDSYLEFQTVGFGPASIVRRTAPDLTGPWSAPDTVHTPPQVLFPRIMIYQGKAHPYLEGADLVVTYSTNSFDFEDHMTQTWLYYPRFVRLSGP